MRTIRRDKRKASLYATTLSILPADPHHTYSEEDRCELVENTLTEIDCRKAIYRTCYVTSQTETDFSNLLLVDHLHHQHGLEERGEKIPTRRIDYQRLKHLIAYCEDWHDECKPTGFEQLEIISLIDVETYKLIKYPAGKECKYAAHSYVWGGAQALPFEMGRLPANIPPTISDAILIVKNLGLKYLWVDSICINQAQESEKKAQIQLMGSIYSAAFVTIVALSAESAHTCLLGVATTDPKVEPWRTFPGQESYKIVKEGRAQLEQELDYSQWACRGWTFQEGVLSRRCLLFTNHLVYFCCNEIVACESPIPTEFWRIDSLTELESRSYHHVALDNHFLRGLWKFSREQQYEIFGRMVGEYTSRQLSHCTDNLNAVAGLLREFERVAFPGGFHYGLPKDNFRCSLGWRSQEQCVAHAYNQRPCWPSWAYIGWRTRGPLDLYPPVKYTQPPLRIWMEEAELLTVDNLNLEALLSKQTRPS